MEPLIQLRNLEKVVEAGPNKFYLLRRINLDIQPGEFVTIMGPSGAGKSTLLSIIGMLDGAWNGDYYFLSEAVHKLNVKKRNELHKANIGFVFQSYHLIDNLTVFENLEVPLSYKNVPHKERVSLVCDALDRFHIVGKKDLFPSQLSGGQQQLVGVARAVILSPKLILADEPTGNLCRHNNHPGHTLGKKCRLWEPHYPTERRVGGGRQRHSQCASGGSATRVSRRSLAGARRCGWFYLCLKNGSRVNFANTFE